MGPRRWDLLVMASLIIVCRMTFSRRGKLSAVVGRPVDWRGRFPRGEGGGRFLAYGLVKSHCGGMAGAGG
jgi:hypothetical protein